MNTGAAGHAVAVELLLRVRLERISARKKFVAACKEQNENFG